MTEVSHNIAKMSVLCEEAATAGAKIIVFPELAVNGFLMNSDQTKHWKASNKAVSNRIAYVSCYRIFFVTHLPPSPPPRSLSLQIFFISRRCFFFFSQPPFTTACSFTPHNIFCALSPHLGHLSVTFSPPQLYKKGNGGCQFVRRINPRTFHQSFLQTGQTIGSLHRSHSH